MSDILYLRENTDYKIDCKVSVRDFSGDIVS